MQIVNKKLKYGEVTVSITNNEDLWYLSHVIEEGDHISGSTERKIKIGSGENAKTTRKHVFLKIKSVKVEYSPENNSLRILGKITFGPDDVPLGEHHSFDLSIQDKITIQKESWPNYQLEKLKEATKEKANIILVVFDREEAKFAELRNTGYSILSELKGDVQKKAEETKNNNNFYKEIVKQLIEYDLRKKTDHIVIASPAFWKEYLMKELPDNLKKKTVTTTVSGVDESSFSELIKRTELHKLLEDERTSKELRLVDEIMTAINNEKAAYGYKDTKEKAESGALKVLAVTENLLKKMKSENKYQEIDYLLKNAESVKTEILIISGKESSQKLDSLGGIAGILRW